MKFEFSFEKLLEYRLSLENIAKRDWVDAQRKVDEAERELREMYDQIDHSREQALKLQRQGGKRSASLMQIDEFVELQKILIEKKKRQIRELKSIAEEKQGLLVEAARERKILEKLKEKRFEEFKKKRKKHEIKVIDDLVVMRHGRFTKET